MKLAIIGQKETPSRAGGVEIHVEEIASRLACYGENVTVYCRESYCEEKYDKYKGINIKYIPSINTKHLDAITYTFLATIDAIKSKSEYQTLSCIRTIIIVVYSKNFRYKGYCYISWIRLGKRKVGYSWKVSIKARGK